MADDREKEGSREPREMQEMLTNALEVVMALYVFDCMFLRERLSTGDRKVNWESIANIFPPFSSIISKLWIVIQAREIGEKIYTQETFSFMEAFYFGRVPSFAARSLLVDVLFYRSIGSNGLLAYLDYVTREAKAMASELRIDGGLEGEAMESLTLPNVIEAILTGNLKLTRQTKLGNNNN